METVGLEPTTSGLQCEEFVTYTTIATYFYRYGENKFDHGVFLTIALPTELHHPWMVIGFEPMTHCLVRSNHNQHYTNTGVISKIKRSQGTTPSPYRWNRHVSFLILPPHVLDMVIFFSLNVPSFLCFLFYFQLILYTLLLVL